MSTVSSRAWLGTALGLLVGVLAGLLIAGSAASGDPSVLLTGPLRFFVMLVLAAVVLTSLHETAHATVARLVGWELFGVTIGHGRRHASIDLGSFRLELRGVLIGGVTIARPTGSRGRDVPMLLAGVTVELIVIAATFTWMPTSTWGGQARWAIITVACIDIVVNLWPRRLDAGPVDGMATDGAQLLSVLTTPDQWRRDIERMQVTPERARLLQTLYGGDLDAAIDLAHIEAANDPNDAAAVELLGGLLLAATRWRDAFELLAPLAAAPDAAHLLTNNAAWAAVMTFDPSLLPSADGFSERAFATRPTEAACANTRGATLVQLGRAGEGLELLELAASGRLSRKQRAYVLAFTALAEHRLGRFTDATAHLSTSEALDRECPALSEVRRIMSEPIVPAPDPMDSAAWPAPWPAPRSFDRVDVA